jgi:hypothetical protein
MDTVLIGGSGDTRRMGKLDRLRVTRRDDNTRAALAVKEAAPLTAALRKLELAKTRADAALAVAEKALAAAKTDQAKARAEDQKQKAAAKVEELQTQLDAAKANGKSRLDAAAAA